eukprot:2898693-Prymnesium_polylepis.1
MRLSPLGQAIRAEPSPFGAFVPCAAQGSAPCICARKRSWLPRPRRTCEGQGTGVILDVAHVRWQGRVKLPGVSAPAEPGRAVFSTQT